MIKILILAYDFPPYVSVGGLRPYSWYLHFKEFGIEPIVVTRQWRNKHGNHLDYIAPSESGNTIAEKTKLGTIIKTPYKPNLANRIFLKYDSNKFVLLRKIISAYYEFMQFLFFVGPKAELYRGAEDYLKRNKVDLILATGDPFILFKYANTLSLEFNIPWIADYRDPWVQDKSRQKNIILQNWDAFWERRLLKNAKCIITVSSFCKKLIQKNVKNKTFHIIPNGFNESHAELAQNPQSKTIFKIAFAGTIYPWHSWVSVLHSLNKHCSEIESMKLELMFYGVNLQFEIENHIKLHYPILKDKVFFSPKIPNELLLTKLANANAMLLFNDYSILGTKIFDYLLLKRIILFCFSEDKEASKLKEKHYYLEEFKEESNSLQEDLIRSTNSGIIVKDTQHLYKVLGDLSEEFEDKGYIECNSVNIEQYSRKRQTERLAGVIREVLGVKC